MAEVLKNTYSPVYHQVFWKGNVVDADSLPTVKVYDITDNPEEEDPGLTLLLTTLTAEKDETNTGILTGIKRAQFSTTQIAHSPVSTDNGLWSRKQFKIGTTTQTNLTAPSFSLQQRALKLSTDNDSGASKISSLSNAERRKYIQIGLADLKKSNYKRFECTMRIVNKQPGEEVGDVDSLGGIFFDYNPATNSGYFIELGLDYTTATYKTANANKSVNIYKIKYILYYFITQLQQFIMSFSL